MLHHARNMERIGIVCPRCCEPTGNLGPNRPYGIALSCASCSHEWITVDEPDDAALVDVVADLFVPNPGMVTDKGMAESAFKAAEAIGFSRGWKRTEIRQYADRVKRRVAVRLLALEMKR